MEDIESLPEFQALIIAAKGKPERNMGDSVIPAEPPIWGDVRRLARDIAKTSPDQLVLHIYLIQAESNIDGFVGFQRSLQDVEDLMRDRWDTMYPAPDLDDPDDMYYERVNLLHQLSDRTDILSGQPDFPDSVHHLPLVDVRGVGAFSARDIDICAGTVTGSEEGKARCRDGLIRGAFAETDAEQLQALANALASVCASCQSIEKLFIEHSGQTGVLSLQRLYERVNGCRLRFHEYADEHMAGLTNVDAEELSSGTDENSSDEQSRSSVPAKAGSLNSRAMVREAFDTILLFYQENEPSSPVRIFAHRASEFVDKSFFEILQELAPNRKDDLPALLEQLEKQPLVYLFSDSYNRFVSGETLPIVSLPEASMAASEQPQPLIDEDSENSVDGENLSISTASTSDAGQASGNTNPIHVVSSREHVLEILQDIEAYFVNNELASPVPLIVGEFRKLVSKRFVELIAEFSRTVPNPAAE